MTEENKMRTIFSSKLTFLLLFCLKSSPFFFFVIVHRIVKYLNGKYHLEEIAALEKLTRLQILTIIEKFQTIVVRALHPDPNPIFQI